MTGEERRRLEALWRPTLVEVDGRTYVCGAANPRTPHPGGFVWLTSDQPDGQAIGDETTAARRVALGFELARRGWTWSPALSRSPSGDHEELGAAVHGIRPAAAIELARDFGQLAVFVVTSDGAMDIAWCV